MSIPLCGVPPLLKGPGERVEEHNLCLLNIMSAPIFGGRNSSIVDLSHAIWDWRMEAGGGDWLNNQIIFICVSACPPPITQP